MDIGVLMVQEPGRAAQHGADGRAARASTGCCFPDSQNLAPEVWGQLMLAAAATSTVRLGPGRHQLGDARRGGHRLGGAGAAGGEQRPRGARHRARRLVGAAHRQARGSRSPAFERYLRPLQAYLRGESVDRDGFASRLEWLARVNVAEGAGRGRRDRPPRDRGRGAPRRRDLLRRRRRSRRISATCSGTRARRRAAAGRDPGALRYGAFVNCVIHDDVAVARDAVRGSVATFARFSSFAGSRSSALPPPLQSAARYLREHYDMREHTRTGVRARRRTARRLRRLVRHRRPGRDRAAALPPARRPRASTSSPSFPARPACRARSPPRRCSASRTTSCRRCAPSRIAGHHG